VSQRRAPSGGTSTQSGQAIIWVAVMLPFFLSVIGLAMDGGVVFSARREIQNVADAAARAGAMQVDQATLRATGNTTIVLDANRARQAAADEVAFQGRGVSAQIGVEPRRVEVQVQRAVPTSFLRLAGIRTVVITATAVAGPRHGVATSER